MSLIDDFTEEYVILDKVTQNDAIGGYEKRYTEGATISGAMTFDSSMQARIAQAQGVKSVYTFTTKKDIILEYHDVIRRKSDSKVFRVTQDGDDKFTPKGASLNMRQVTCEEWTIPEE